MAEAAAHGRAPLLIPVLAFLAGIVLSELAGAPVPRVALLCALAVGIALFVLLLVRQSRLAIPLLILTCAVAGAARHAAYVDPPGNHVSVLLSDEPILTRLTADVITRPAFNPPEQYNPFSFFAAEPRMRFLAEVRSFEADEPFAAQGAIRVTVLGADPPDLRPGDRVGLTGWLTRPRAARNPGEVDWAAWNRLQGVSATLLVPATEHVRRLDGGSHWRAGLDRARATARALLFEPAAQVEPKPETHALEAMVLGQRSAVPRAVNEAFLRTGSIHFLTVSGFHVGALAAATWFTTRRLLRRRAVTAAVVTLAVLVAYALLAETTAPVMRATVVGGLVCVAAITGRPRAALNWLALAAGLICAVQPLELFRPGFQLSFILTLALLVFVPAIWRRFTPREDALPSDAASWPALLLRWIGRFVAGLALVSVVAWAMAIPLTMLHFSQFAPLAAIQSMIVTPLALLSVLAGFVALALGAVPAVGSLLRAALDWLGQALLTVVGWLGAPGFALIEVKPPPGWLVYGTYAVLFAMFAAWARRRGSLTDEATSETSPPRGQWWRYAPLGALALFWIAWVVSPRRAAVPELVVLDVGHGSAALLCDASGVAWSFDAGSLGNRDAGDIVNRATRAIGARRLDAISVSHANFDHFSGAPTVLRETGARLQVNPYFERVSRVDPVMRRLAEMLPAGTRREALRAGDQFELAGVTIETLWPPDDLDESWAANDRSLVFRLQAGPTRVLITGDIEEAAMRGLLARRDAGEIALESEILVAPHHGAWIDGASDDFYRAVNPALVIASAGKETPRLEAGLTYAFGECPALTTRDHGAIRVRLGSGGWTVTPTTTPPE